MITVTFQGFRDMAHARAFADWYDGQGEQDSHEWLGFQDQPSAYLARGEIVTEDNITLTLRDDID